MRKGVTARIGRTFVNGGYVYRLLPHHPLADKHNGYVLEHRRVAMDVMGFSDLNGMHVHHKDHDKTNNDPSNLQVVSKFDHPKLHSLWRMVDGQMRKPCAACKQLTPEEGFYRRKIGFTARCKPCYRIWNRESKRRCKLNGYKRK